MAPRGRRNGAKHRQNFRNKPHKGRNKRNKSFNLHQIKSRTQEKSTKRSFEEEENFNLKSKRQKVVEKPPQIEEDSSSEEEDQMKQLLSTFGPNLVKKSVAIDSSDDSLSEGDASEAGVSEQESLDEESNKDEQGSNQDHSEDESIGETGSDELSDAVEHESDDELENEDESKNESELDNQDKTDSRKEIQDENQLMTTNELKSKEAFKEEAEVDVETQKEDEDVAGNLQDPFARHLFYEMSDSLLTSVQNIPMLVNNHSEDWPVLNQILVQIPKCEESTKNVSQFSIADQKPFAPAGTVPSRINLCDSSLESIYIKTQIVNNVANANKSVSNIDNKLPLTSLQSELFSIINNYQDFYYTRRTFENAEEIRFIYCLHIVNHILKTRTKVLHHNARLTKKDDVPEEFRDQGLVRPKILVVVPFRDSAYRIISMLIDILIPDDKGNVMNKNRFVEEFTGHEIAMPKKNPKPEDYEILFSGNTGDDFKIGITVTKKSLKLFADFYSSDIIIASPLGLRTIIGADGEAERNYDFLASIELLILDQTEIFLMQNWDHLLHIINHLHLQPKESHGTDFSRVRTWSLNGWAKYYRQTLIFSSIVLPEINAIFNKKCFNYAGKVKTVNAVPVGSICQVFLQLPHVFHKFSADDVAQLAEARFKFFIGKILPQQRDTLMRQTLIFVSNYFDYVRLRNYFKKEDIGFVQICEYSKEGKVARARDMFFHGDAHFLLYTERYHFFNRVRIKGIRHLVFYQPPIFPHFYYEICNLMQEANMNKKVGSMSNMTVTILYSKYDANQLAGIVGTERAARMVQSDRNVHMLVTDGK